MWSSALLFILLIVFFIVYLYKSIRAKPKNFPPGPPKLPIWGGYWYLLKENYNFAHLALDSLGKKYKTDILGCFLGDTPAVATFSTELCKELLTREEFMGRNDTIIVRTRGLGDLKGVLNVDGQFWKEQRKFSLRHMRDYGFGRRSDVIEDFMADEIKSLLNFLHSEPDEADLDVCREKGLVLMPDILYGPLLNSIMLILASTRFDYYKLRQYARAGLRCQRSGDATGNAITITPWLRFLAPDFFGYTPVVVDNGYLLDFLRTVIDNHLETFSSDHLRDFIDVYIDENIKQSVKLDYNQLLLTVLDYMFPAAMAIGHTLSFYFVYLINHPQVQFKIQEEIDRVVGRSRLPHLDDRKDMPYLEASIRELIRIIPINPLGVPRRCTQDTYLAGYFIPKDTIMLPCLWSAHRDERVWKDPETFNPERFLNEEGNLLKKDYTMAFGAGKRLCAGETFARQHMFMIISSLLQNFTLKSPNSLPVVLDIVPGLNLSLKENWVRVEPRK